MVGNIPNFTNIDVLRCFLRFNRNTSRHELAREMELGEGTVRSILEVLKSKRLLGSNKKGHFLSKKGKKTLGEINGFIKLVKGIKTKSLYPGLEKIGVQLKGTSGLKEIYKLRDVAVKHGAEGALILEFDGNLRAPDSNYEQDYKELERLFNLKSGDVLAIAFSSEKRKAENGALAIAIELCSPLKKFISEL